MNCSVHFAMAGLVALFSGAIYAEPSGTDKVVPWLKRLKSDDEATRTAAAYGLNIPGDCPPDEIALLLKALKDPSPFTRRYVAAALGEIRPPTEQSNKALIAALSDSDIAVRQQAAVALSKVGPTAIPILLDRLKTLTQPKFSKNNAATGIMFALSSNGDAIIEPLVEFVRHQPARPDQIPKRKSSAKTTKENASNNRLEACAGFLLAKVGMPAVPSLVRLLEDKTKAGFGLSTLRQIEPVYPLIQDWNSSDEEVREFSRQSVTSSDGTFDGLVVALTKGLSHQSVRVRKAAIAALDHCRVEGKITRAIAPLAAALSDVDPSVRGVAARCLAEIVDTEEVTESVTKQLLVALQGSDQAIRPDILRVLSQINCREALPQIQKCARDPKCRSPDVIQAIGRLGSSDPSSVETLLLVVNKEKDDWESLTDRDRLAILRSLTALGSAAKPAIPILMKWFAEADDRDVATTIVRIGQDGVAALDTMLKDPHVEKYAKQEACAALTEVAAKNETAKEALKSVLSDPDPGLRRIAAEALASAGYIEIARPIVSEIIGKEPLFEDPDLLALMMQVGIEPTAAIDQLKPGSKYVDVALSAVKRAGVTDKRFVQPLLKLLDDESESIRTVSAETLGDFDAFREQIIPSLDEKLRDSDEGVREACLNSILQLSFFPTKFSPSLRKLINDKFVEKTLTDFYFDLVGNIPPPTHESERVIVTGSNIPTGRGSLPAFPWPPPSYSTVGVFGRDFPRELLGDDTSTLGVIYKRLYDALERCDANFETGLFQVPGGFALLSKMERVEADGTPLPGRYHWAMGTVPPLSLADYVARLFVEKPGFFRVIAFLVTDEINFGQSENKLPAIGWGGTDLPPNIAAIPFKGRQCYALVYSFEKKRGSPTAELTDAPLSAKVHLIKAGFLSALSRP